ncbi:hypothetical protein [Streptomyces sp. NPDC056983]|uniref:hypothetical protein n=1 Tax=Streptomyces sp. NPDC056983 TaxID=3345987 RepID=UPI003626A71D
MEDRALTGRFVVRLKGGDPYLVFAGSGDLGDADADFITGGLPIDCLLLMTLPHDHVRVALAERPR